MREDILKMAREAGSCDSICNGCLKVDVFCEKSLERFAELVEDAHSKRTFDEGFVTVGHMREQIAAERNKLAHWMMAQGYATGHGDTTEDLLQELGTEIEAKIAAEREACAKVCEDKNILLAWPTYAAAIRERGQT